MQAEEILAELVGFASVVGRPNGPIAGRVAERLDGAGARVTLLPGPEGDRVNLFATFGPADEPGLLLSGHMDVVPAEEPDWTTDPFRLTADGERLVGRGTSDMKGFLAAAMAAVSRLDRAGLRRPVHLAFSYDEEAGCRGVPHLIARLPRLCALPVAAVIGEPSGLVPILAHKGKAAARIVVTGRAGHSSRPDLGLNAVHGIAEVVVAAVAEARRLEAGLRDARFAPPWSTLHVGVVRGGEALNVIPASAVAEVEARAVAGVSPPALLAPVRAALDALAVSGYGVAWETLCDYPALALSAEAPIARLLADLSGAAPIPAVSYGTEAGLYQAAGIDAIVCGPGDIARAHKAGEWIGRAELAAATDLVERLCRRFAAEPAEESRS